MCPSLVNLMFCGAICKYVEFEIPEKILCILSAVERNTSL